MERIGTKNIMGEKRIVEMGTHAELMARDGLYRRLNEVQSALSRRGEDGHTTDREAIAASGGVW